MSMYDEYVEYEEKDKYVWRVKDEYDEYIKWVWWDEYVKHWLFRLHQMKEV